MVYMTRDSLRFVPPVFLDSREASPMKTQTQERAGGLGKSLWVASYLVPPNRPLSVWLKKTLLCLRATVGH